MAVPDPERQRGRECRLYLDSTWTLDGHTHEATEAAARLGLVEDLCSVTPTRATVTADGSLVLVGETHHLSVSGAAASNTGGELWWLARATCQGPRPAEP